ncbi:Ubiquitin carboxyl-terminal hydrolase [Actinidia chinensis var. chinensis]|uniref:Ubiquitin carboxyl-terminal hydrolase n=1 Tax=Actinidia chinensis var. chinensis TaxID=1590841 RepID=A0A2R6QS43_ACTCC|nr:Ubiquitin carboxyl-terminal hydrolase [Actinidia chinensis var. chinensis]
MAETLITPSEANTQSGGLPDPTNTVGSVITRRIDFQLAKKPFAGFSNGDGGFRLETLNPSSSDPHKPGGPNMGNAQSCWTGAGKRVDGSEFLDAGLDPEISFGITFRRIGAGLENLGNTCFLNSVLQCLTYTEPLAAYLQSGKHRNSCRTAGFCALCAIQKHVSHALQLTGRSLAPKDLVSNLRCISRSFRNARQEDAHEYMVNLLESMHKCCLPAGVPSESPSAYEKSLVHKIFGGRLRSQVKCVQCSFCSNKFDPFLDLSLEINKAESLNKALSHFTAKEYLDGGERLYHCQKCRLKVKALKQLTIYKAPCVLTIHLKRFGTHQPGQKIDKNVHFGPTLDLKPFVTGPYDGELKYTLYGVLVHAGWNTHSGHYYCFVRTSSGMWYILDDHQVRQVSEKVVLEQKAYMLFYVRDRRNFAPKKQADVQKESMINTMGQKTHSNLNGDIKQAVQNGPIDKRVNGGDSSASVPKKDVIIADALKEILTKESLIQKADSLTTTVSSDLNKAPLLDIPSKVPVCKDAVEGSSDLSHIKGSCNAINNAVFAPAGGNTNKFNKERCTKDDLSVVVVEATNCCGPQTLITKKDPSNVVVGPPKCEDKNSQKDLTESVTEIPDCNGHHISAGGVCIADKTSQKDSDEKESVKIDPSKSVDQPHRQNNEVEGVSKEGTLGDNGQRKGIIESVELSGLQTTDSSLHQETLDRKCQQKLKKKPRKRHITSMHLGSSILFGASLILRKKKHKKIKGHIIKTKNLTREHLLDRECSPTDLGLSTSEISWVLSLGGTVHSRGGTVHSRGKVLTSGLRKKDNIAVAKNVKGSNCVKKTIDEKFIDRPGQNGAVLATGEQPKSNSSSSLAGNWCDPRVANGLKESRSNSVQNGLMCIPTRGLEEKVVARWDEIELPSSQITESNGATTASIGHIGDEWDEEYDRGKRKKVRTSVNVFGGPNPFQEIATKKAKLKKVKMDQSSSGNQPFRI